MASSTRGSRTPRAAIWRLDHPAPGPARRVGVVRQRREQPIPSVPQTSAATSNLHDLPAGILASLEPPRPGRCSERRDGRRAPDSGKEPSFEPLRRARRSLRSTDRSSDSVIATKRIATSKGPEERRPEDRRRRSWLRPPSRSRSGNRTMYLPTPIVTFGELPPRRRGSARSPRASSGSSPRTPKSGPQTPRGSPSTARSPCRGGRATRAPVQRGPDHRLQAPEEDVLVASAAPSPGRGGWPGCRAPYVDQPVELLEEVDAEDAVEGGRASRTRRR